MQISNQRTFIDVRHSVESVRELLERGSVLWSPLPALVHEIVDGLGAALRALHAVARLQQFVDL